MGDQNICSNYSKNTKNVNIWEVQIIKWWKLTTPLWSCVAFAWIKWNIWFMGHVFKDKDVPNMINKTRSELKKYWFNLDDCTIYISWWASSDLFSNSKFRPWDDNLKAVQQWFWNKIRQICVWWKESRFVTLDTNSGEFIVEKITKWWSSRYLSQKCKIH
jgi:hypothetical protein